MNEQKKVGIFESAAFLSGILSFAMLFLPAFWEKGKDSIPLRERIFGNDRIPFNGILFFAFLLLLLALLCSLTLSLFSFLNRFFNEKTVTALGISSGVFFLVSAIVLALGIILTGLNKENSELGLVQGNWGIGIGNILTPLFGFAAFCLSYPAALIIPHHLDIKDKEQKVKA